MIVGKTLRAFLLIIGVGVAIILGEAFVRIGGGSGRETRIMEFMIPHEVLNHVHPASYTGRYRSPQGEFDTKVSFNAQGLRDYDYANDRFEDVFRILVLGDSFVEAAQVDLEESFVKLIEARLNALGQRHYEVINAGVSSYSPAVEYLYLKEQGLALSPDLVLVVLSVNDVYDDYHYSHASTARFDDQGFPLAFPPRFSNPPLFQIRWWLRRHSDLYFFLSDRMAMLRHSMPNNHIHQINGDISKSYLAIFSDNPSKEVEEAWKLSWHYLLGIQNLSYKTNASMAMVVIPHSMQVSVDEWKEGKLALNYEAPTVITSTMMQDGFQKFADARGIPMLDLLPRLREAAKKELLYLPYDGHWNIQGHKVAAEEITKFLRALVHEGRMDTKHGGNGINYPRPYPLVVRKGNTGSGNDNNQGEICGTC